MIRKLGIQTLKKRSCGQLKKFSSHFLGLRSGRLFYPTVFLFVLIILIILSINRITYPPVSTSPPSDPIVESSQKSNLILRFSLYDEILIRQVLLNQTRTPFGGLRYSHRTLFSSSSLGFTFNPVNERIYTAYPASLVSEDLHQISQRKLNLRFFNADNSFLSGIKFYADKFYVLSKKRKMNPSNDVKPRVWIIDKDDINGTIDLSTETISYPGFFLDPSNNNPRNMEISRNRIHIINNDSVNGHKVFIYNLDGSSATPSQFDLESSTLGHSAMFLSGGYLYVGNIDLQQFRAYRYSTGRFTLYPTESFAFSPSNTRPVGGEWIAGHIFILDANRNVYVYAGRY